MYTSIGMIYRFLIQAIATSYSTAQGAFCSLTPRYSTTLRRTRDGDAEAFDGKGTITEVEWGGEGR